ncbi:MAG: hypothetical protein PHE51_05580 [Eubacteriales bacterium]|nr:hypothetical protein [Eubacteriales bacterium]
MADGTLLITWQDSTLKRRVLLLRKKKNKSLTGSILAILPEKIKKNTKVSSNG